MGRIPFQGTCCYERVATFKRKGIGLVNVIYGITHIWCWLMIPKKTREMLLPPRFSWKCNNKRSSETSTLIHFIIFFCVCYFDKTKRGVTSRLSPATWVRIGRNSKQFSKIRGKTYKEALQILKYLQFLSFRMVMPWCNFWRCTIDPIDKWAWQTMPSNGNSGRGSWPGRSRFDCEIFPCKLQRISVLPTGSPCQMYWWFTSRFSSYIGFR